MVPQAPCYGAAFMPEHTKVAALYVDLEAGPYPSIPGVVCYGKAEDARLYEGPYPVVAHPPCQAWGRFRTQRCRFAEQHGWGTAEYDDSGAEMICGPRAVDQVRRWGGILEHPYASRLWDYCQLPRPGLFRDDHGGYTVELNQGSYGHEAPKRTWLYCVGVDLRQPDLRRPSFPEGRVHRQWSDQRHLTPHDFAVFLVQQAALATLRKHVAAL